MKQKKKVSNIMLVLIIIAIVLYTAATFVLQYFTQVEISPTLTTAWFAFWTVEIVALAAIKTSKVKHNQDSSNPTNEDVEEPNYCEDDTQGLILENHEGE